MKYSLLAKKFSVFSVINLIILGVLFFVTLYPFWYVMMLAFSSGDRASGYELIFLPVDFTFVNVKYVLSTPDFFGIYVNTIFVVVVGTILSLVATALLAYGLSQKIFGIRVVRMVVMFTMLFSGGMIPTYLTVRDTGLLNSLWALIIPAMISPFNVFLMVNAFKEIPDSLSESAYIDGAGVVKTLIFILLPLMKATLATLCLFYAVAYWNTYLSAILYTPKRENWTLQVLLRQILINNDQNGVGTGGDNMMSQLSTNVKMATIFVSIVPIMLIYPFLQKYFTSGVMVGAVKE